MNAIYWIWLAERCGQGSSEMLTLVEKLGPAENIYRADGEAYAGTGVSERLCEDLCNKSLDGAQRILSFCQGAGVGLLCYDDPAYPASLRALKNPPALLYYLGELPDFNHRLCIAIVGTRRMSEYGMRAAYKIAYEVAASRAIVVSGLALGIDGIASCAAIAAGGTTVAVLGCGIDVVYPKEHETLFGIVRQNGCILTEYPPSEEPRGTNFPVRNRIISGLSQGTVVVDADQKSGAMITAKNAILQGRDIYAVPGNIDAENTSGTNTLIRDGAQAVLGGSDIIKNYAFMYRHCLNIQRMNNAEATSDFNPDAVRRMGVSVSLFSSVGERRQETASQKLPTQERRPKKPTQKPIQEKAAVQARPQKQTDLQSAPARESLAHHADAERQPAQTVTPGNGGDRSAEILEKLTEKQRKVFEQMPLDRAVTVDYLTKTGFQLGEVISALTVLEIKGLVSSLPGALYIRK